MYLTHKWNPNRYNTTTSQSGSGSNGNKEVQHTPHISKFEVSPSDAVWCHTQDTPINL